MHSGTNLPMVRDHNERVVLQVIREQGGASRAEIAEKTGLTAQTVSNIAKRLLTRRLVEETDNGAPKRGKPGSKLRVNARSRYAMGVQIDGDEISLVVTDMLGRVTARTQHPTLQQGGPSGVISQVAASVDLILRDAGLARDEVLGVGVACPGPLDHQRGVVYRATNLLGWYVVHLKDALEEETGLSVIVDNDATAAAIGERWSGKAQSSGDFAFVYVGVGVGVGLCLGGRIHRGATTSAGEFGHIILDPDGPECFCGNRGCLEVYCAPRSVALSVSRRIRRGEPSVLREAYETGAENVTYEAVCRAAAAGDALALSEVEHSARMLGYGVAGLVNLLDVDLVVLGGRAFREAKQVYQSEVERAVRQNIVAGDRRRPEVELSAMGESAGALGAASLILHTTYAPMPLGFGRG